MTLLRGVGGVRYCRSLRTASRGFHSSTSQLSVSRFCDFIAHPIELYPKRIADVELESEHVKAPGYQWDLRRVTCRWSGSRAGG
jgi:hypothetical protein